MRDRFKIELKNLKRNMLDYLKSSYPKGLKHESDQDLANITCELQKLYKDDIWGVIWCLVLDEKEKEQ